MGLLDPKVDKAKTFGDFVGKSMKEIRDLNYQRDVAYLRS